MYDVRQFRPALYFLLLLGVTGFALAAESPQLWVLATGGILINAWLIKTGRFSPMPRLMANIVTLGAVAVVAVEIRTGGSPPILTIGQFIVVLHLVKLFEQRGNRDYAQLLILSLLLMVAAAISTASLFFGITFFVYLFVSLHCCLLFHLKVESDQARAAYGALSKHFNPALLRQDQRDLPRSMRRLTGVMALVSLVMAVVVFLFFPRGAGQGMFNPNQMRSIQALTGFSDDVTFEKIAQITENDDVVARVELYEDDVRVTHPSELLLRGSVLDIYTGGKPRVGGRWGRWEWRRSPPPPSHADTPDANGFNASAGQEEPLAGNGRGAYRQEIMLQPTGTDKLFAMAGPVSITMNEERDVFFSPWDGVLETRPIPARPIKYTVVSTGRLGSELPTPNARSATSSIDPEIQRYASQPSVSGVDAAGRPLYQYPMLSQDHSQDGTIAANIAHHLKTQFQYSLNLTDYAALSNGDRDPIVAFLTDFKKGHCEYFAGAMTLMCQSLHIPARYVVGFRCEPEDFNTLGNYYVVKQSNAHAWCEVYTGQGWVTFDPTSGRGALDSDVRRTYLADLKNALDYVEYKWASSVVAYDVGARNDLIGSLDMRMTNSAISGSQSINGVFGGVFDKLHRAIALESVQDAVIGSMVVLIVVAVLWFLAERWRFRRRARRIGLSALSATDQLRLVRQLGFYDDLLRILERHGIVRPKHLTPLEFSHTLSYLPSHVYEDIHRLTRLFYRIRYGSNEAAAHPRRHLATVVHRVQQTLDASS